MLAGTKDLLFNGVISGYGKDSFSGIMIVQTFRNEHKKNKKTFYEND